MRARTTYPIALAMALLPALAPAAQKVIPPAGDAGAAEAGTPADIASADPALVHALSSSTEGLFVESIPGGGEIVHLQGRFRQVVFARVEPSGAVAVAHEMPFDLLFGSPAPAACRELAPGTATISGGGDARH